MNSLEGMVAVYIHNIQLKVLVRVANLYFLALVVIQGNVFQDSSEI